MFDEFNNFILHDGKKENEFYKIRDKENDEHYSFAVLDETHLKEISDLYKSYNGEQEFLYVPGKEEIAEVLAAPTSNYVGIRNKEEKLVGLLKVEHLVIPSSFFVPPVSERGDDKVFYGISGLLVHDDFRKQGIAKRLVNVTLRSLKRSGKVDGVYADCAYDNVASFSTLSKFLSLAGYTDGRQGADGERTIYTTFYKPLKTEYAKTVTLKQLKLPQIESLDDVANVLRFALENPIKKEEQEPPVRLAKELRVAYGTGYNSLYVLEKPVKTIFVPDDGSRKLTRAPVLNAVVWAQQSARGQR